MYYTGFADEAANDIAGQIRATKTLGWEFIESRRINGVNIHDMPEEDFDKVCEALDASGVKINCFGSEVANWQRDLFKEDDYYKSIEQLARAIRRMKRLGCDMIRGMSFKAKWRSPPSIRRSRSRFSARSGCWSASARTRAFTTCTKTATTTAGSHPSTH